MIKRRRPGLRFDRRSMRAMPVGVVGAGAIGSSVGLALRRIGVATWGLDRRSDHLDQATRLGALTGRVDRLEDLPECQLVFVALPPSEVVPAVVRLLEITDATILDVASTKGLIAEAVPHARFVPSHPMRGTHISGPQGARGDLFDGAGWALCPTSSTSAASLRLAKAGVRAMGAEPVVIDASVHDELVAATSHLPHVAASGLVNCVGAKDPQLAGQLIGDGFWDTTRIARACPSLWTEIVMSNGAQVRKSIRELVDRMQALDEALVSGDRAAVAEYFEPASGVLEALAAGCEAARRPVHNTPMQPAGRELVLRRPPALNQLKGAH